MKLTLQQVDQIVSFWHEKAQIKFNEEIFKNNLILLLNYLAQKNRFLQKKERDIHKTLKTFKEFAEFLNVDPEEEIPQPEYQPAKSVRSYSYVSKVNSTLQSNVYTSHATNPFFYIDFDKNLNNDLHFEVLNGTAIGVLQHLIHGGKFKDLRFFPAITARRVQDDPTLELEEKNVYPQIFWALDSETNKSYFWSGTMNVFLEEGSICVVENQTISAISSDPDNDETIRRKILNAIFEKINNHTYIIDGPGITIDKKVFSKTIGSFYLDLRRIIDNFSPITPEIYKEITDKIYQKLRDKTESTKQYGFFEVKVRDDSTAKLHGDIIDLIKGRIKFDPQTSTAIFSKVYGSKE